MENQMFCYQCQETAGCKGCTRMGVCGKNPQVAAMQDLLVFVSKGISAVTTQLRKEGKSVSADVNQMVTLNLFITITNANFDEDMIALTKKHKIFEQRFGDLKLSKEPEKMIAFYRKGLLFAFNFHPTNSLTNLLIPVDNYADYTVAMSSDDEQYGGFNQVEHIKYPVKRFNGQNFIEIYLPARTAVVLEEGRKRPVPKKILEAEEMARQAAEAEAKARAEAEAKAKAEAEAKVASEEVK